MFVVSKSPPPPEINAFIHQGHNNLIKSGIKDI